MAAFLLGEALQRVFARLRAAARYGRSRADGTSLDEHGLRRSVGVSGLFATAYGNVGSSIYYALGLVAAHALGLTPLVFLFAGGLFALTAKTYAEGAVDVPGGRRLLVVRAPRVQRRGLVLRRLGAEPRLHPHDRDLGVLRAALPERASRACTR